MSMQIIYGKYVPTCDICGEELPPCHDFQEAVLSKRKAGWKTRHVDDGWEDTCVDCQEAEGE